MEEGNAKHEQLSIVLAGSFNPMIFQPSWFAKHNILSKEEAKTAKDAASILVSPEVTQIILPSLSLIVMRDKLTAQAQNLNYEILKDLIIGTLELLIHTPIAHVGINLEAHYQLASEQIWHKFGDLLAPKEIWEGITKNPGMGGLKIQSERGDDYQGSVNIRVAPSYRIHPGVYIHLNDHFDLRSDSSNTHLGAKNSLDLLEAVWEESIENARKAHRHLLSKAV